VMKLTPNVTDITAIARACEEGGAEGVCLAGGQLCLPPMDIYHPTAVYPLLDGASMGSLGGPAARLLGYAMVAETARRVRMPIIGGGGIQNWHHGIEFMMWGARLVTVCTEIMWRGWDVATRIIDGMEKFLIDQGYSSYDEIIGLSLPALRAAAQLKASPGAAVVELDRCNGCGLCTRPGHCIAMSIVDGKAVVDVPRCYGCSICVAMCPHHALSMANIEE
jgi:dihydropyrimidine dehydrogenase (NAD+) subunit PreA